MNGLVMYSGLASKSFFAGPIFAAWLPALPLPIPKYLLINRLSPGNLALGSKKLSKNICPIPESRYLRIPIRKKGL